MSGLSEETKALLAETATATLTAQLQRRGIPSTFFTGLSTGKPGHKMIGVAKTLRYVALREDLTSKYQAGNNAQRQAIESVGPGEVLVIECRMDAGAGTIGDILANRARMRGAVGVVTDGCVRDDAAVCGLPDFGVYRQAAHAATLGRRHMPFEIDRPITCAGVFVEPGDVIVGDDDGAMVIPIALVDEVARDAYEQEMGDMFAFERVSAGDNLDGIFPSIGKDRRAEFEAWRKERGK
jgi:5-oxopent-3-ene-1,2,5-tricarboxylate decarboxylase / 2-hydroxyhepta-2,4-diene-1,7-dioate isomerase